MKSRENICGVAIVSEHMQSRYETVGTFRYDASDKFNDPVPTLYIRKEAFDGRPPATITITITPLNEDDE